MLISAYMHIGDAMKIPQTTVFKALADDTRLRIMNLLVSSGKSLCVCEMADALELPQYQISKHLNILKNSGVINVEKSGTWAYHSLDRKNRLNENLHAFLARYVTGEVFDRDIRNLELRLRLREGDRCVVGFV
jgi:ArsR family transcriptional regulator, arsenate/arsenite/antimonite-responsive transcriptional repressor